MAKTGILGTINSKLGQILLGTCTQATDDLEPFAPDSLALTEVVIDGGDVRLSTSDTLTLSDVATTTGPFLVDASDTLVLTDVAPEPGGPFLKAASDSLGLTDTATAIGGAVPNGVVDSLGLSEDNTVSGGAVPDGVADALGLSDEAAVDGGGVAKAASDSLGLTETTTVIGGAGDVASTDSLGLSVTIVDTGDVRLEITDSLGLSEVVFDGGDIREEASDSLSLTDSIQEFEDVSDDLGLTEAAEYDRAFGVDALALTETASVIHDINGNGSDTLDLTDTVVDSWVWNTDVAESLTVTLEQYVIGDPGGFEDIDIGLREFAEAGGDINVTIQDALSWFEIPSGWIIPVAGATETANDSLGLTDVAGLSIDNEAKDVIGLTDAASASIAYSAIDSLDLSDTATVNGDFNVSASDTFVFSESFSSILSDSTCDYDESQAGTYPADTGLSFRLVGVGSWTVRAPRFGNKDIFSPHRVINESRGGTLLITSQPEWPEIEVLKMDFSVLKKQEGLDLQDFLSNNLGQIITLTDWEGRAWTGVVNDTNVPLTEIGTDNFAMGFEFEGTKV